MAASSREGVARDEPMAEAMDYPFTGLFKTPLQAAILEEMVSDPTRVFTVGDLAHYLKCTPQGLREPLDVLTQIGIVRHDDSLRGRRFFLNREAKRFVALELLAYACRDDYTPHMPDAESALNSAVLNYCQDRLSELVLPVAQGTVADFRVTTSAEARQTSYQIFTHAGSSPIRVTSPRLVAAKAT